LSAVGDPQLPALSVTAQQTRRLLRKIIHAPFQRETPILKYSGRLGTNKNVMCPKGVRNQEWMCWRRPAAN
jgi:hypothetical protein